MDSTLLGVMIGSGLSFFGNFLTQFLSSKKEERQWQRQRIANKEDKQEDMIKQEKEYLKELYHKCLLSLSMVISGLQHNDNNENKIDLGEYTKEAHNWLSLLLLRCQDDKLDQLIRSFLDCPEDYETGMLREYVLSLAKNEKAFFYSKSTTKDEGNKETIQASNNARKIIFSIDEEYIKQRIIDDGEELPQSYAFEYKLVELTPKQREALLYIYFKHHKNIPKDVQLYVPVQTQNAKEINFQGKQWKAKLNPFNSNKNEILESWVKDFDEYHKAAIERIEENPVRNS